MKKYICIILSLGFFFSLAYLLSDLYFYPNKYNKQFSNKQVEQTVTIPLDTKIKDDTMITINEYNDVTKTLTTKKQRASANYIGLTREELMKYLIEYKKHPLSIDAEKGLYDIKLESFSDKNIIIEKQYHKEIKDYKYYLCMIDYYVVVYKDDKETIYEYTNIDTRNLSTDLQTELSNGKYIKDDYELFNFLETYSS